MSVFPRRNAAEAAAMIRPGSTVAMSGWAMAGYPKAVPEALVARRAAGEEVSIFLLTGANAPWLDETLANGGVLSRRAPMCAHRSVAAQVNAGSIAYVEQQMYHMPRLLRRGSFGPVHCAVVEALRIEPDGTLVPTSSIGMVQHLLDVADEVIVELNHAQPAALAALHDVYTPAAPPATKPIPLTRVDQRIGGGTVCVDPRKVRAIVETDRPERLGPAAATTTITDRIAGHLFDFLAREYRDYPGGLPPIQTGFGGIADSIVAGFRGAGFRDLQFFGGGVTEPVVELLAAGQAIAVSTGGLGMNERVEEILTAMPEIADHLVIRSGDVANSPEVVGRLGILALNTGIEIDIYGNVNSSHIGGSRVVNGIGGGAGFAQNAGLSVVLLPSVARHGTVSSIVPAVSHLDITEHNVDVVVTEHGLVDLRGLADHERAEAIIATCADESYREPLRTYLRNAQRTAGGHHPQLLEEAAGWHRRLKEEGSMLGETR